MDNRSIYLIVITALMTAFGTFVIGLLHEDYKRHRDTRGLATAFLAEIGSIIQLADQLKIEDIYREKQTEMKQALAEGKGWQASPVGGLTFPITVYEKCADRIGLLQEDAEAIVTFYNFVNGFRVCVRLAIEASDVSLSSRIRVIDLLLAMFTSERPKVKALQLRLRAVCERNWRPFVK